MPRGPWALPPWPCLLLCTQPTSPSHAPRCLAETMHVTLALQLQEVPTLLQPHQDLAVSLFPVQCRSPSPAVLLKPRRISQAEPWPPQRLSAEGDFPSQGTFIWQCLEMLLVVAPQERVLLLSKGQRPGMLLCVSFNV